MCCACVGLPMFALRRFIITGWRGGMRWALGSRSSRCVPWRQVRRGSSASFSVVVAQKCFIAGDGVFFFDDVDFSPGAEIFSSGLRWVCYMVVAMAIGASAKVCNLSRPSCFLEPQRGSSCLHPLVRMGGDEIQDGIAPLPASREACSNRCLNRL